MPFNDYDHYVTPLIDGSNNDPRYVYNIEHWFGDRRYGFKFLKLIKSSPKLEISYTS